MKSSLPHLSKLRIKDGYRFLGRTAAQFTSASLKGGVGVEFDTYNHSVSYQVPKLAVHYELRSFLLAKCGI